MVFLDIDGGITPVPKDYSQFIGIGIGGLVLCAVISAIIIVALILYKRYVQLLVSYSC